MCLFFHLLVFLISFPYILFKSRHYSIFFKNILFIYLAPSLSLGMWVSRFLYSCLMTQSRPTLCGPMDCSPPGSSVHGILQARTLEWVAISSSRGASRHGMEPGSPVSPALASSFFTAEPPGKRGQTQAPALGVWSICPWTTREVPSFIFYI